MLRHVSVAAFSAMRISSSASQQSTTWARMRSSLRWYTGRLHLPPGPLHLEELPKPTPQIGNFPMTWSYRRCASPIASSRSVPTCSMTTWPKTSAGIRPSCRCRNRRIGRLELARFVPHSASVPQWPPPAFWTSETDRHWSSPPTTTPDEFDSPLLRLSGLAAQGGDAGMVGVSRQSLAGAGVLEEVPVKEVHDDLADFGHCGVVHVRTQVRATADGQQEVGDPCWHSIEQADACRIRVGLVSGGVDRQKRRRIRGEVGAMKQPDPSGHHHRSGDSAVSGGVVVRPSRNGEAAV